MFKNNLSYCSLEEAWTNEFSNLYIKDENTEPILYERDITKSSCENLNKNSQNNKEHFVGNSVENNTENKIKNSSKYNCDLSFEHCMNCDQCKNKLKMMIEEIVHSKINKSTQENFGNNLYNNSNELMDLLYIVGIGILVIIFLHFFNKISKRIRF